MIYGENECELRMTDDSCGNVRRALVACVTWFNIQSSYNTAFGNLLIAGSR